MRTPRLAAVEQWIAAGRVGDIAWTPDYDPCHAMTDTERIEYVIANAASGAQAVLPAHRSQEPARGLIPPQRPRRPRRWPKRRTP